VRVLTIEAALGLHQQNRAERKLAEDQSRQDDRNVVEVRPRHPQLAGGQWENFGELHCKLGHAVQIEPSLRPRSLKNGNFSYIRRRLSAISLRNCPNSESGDRPPIHKSPPVAGLSGTAEGEISRRRTSWLTWEDSNFHITISKKAFEISTEFSLFWPKIRLGDFCS
jgi:hypothetical protein